MQNTQDLPLTAPKAETTYKPVPVGTHLARCFQIIEIGTLMETFKGKDPRPTPKIRVRFEIPNLTRVFKDGEDPKPYTIEEEYSFYMNERSNLFKLVTGMLGTTLDQEEAGRFDIRSLIGQTCLLNITHKTNMKGKTHDKITSAIQLMAGMAAPPAVNTPKVLTYSSWDEDFFQKLPSFIREKMKTTPEYAALREKVAEIPF